MEENDEKKGAPERLYNWLEQDRVGRFIMSISAILGSVAGLVFMVYIILMAFWTEEVPVGYEFMPKEDWPSFPPFWICATLIATMVLTFVPATPAIVETYENLISKNEGQGVFWGGAWIAFTPIVSLVRNWYYGDIRGTDDVMILYNITVVFSIIFIPSVIMFNTSVLKKGILGLLFGSPVKKLKKSPDSRSQWVAVTVTGVDIHYYGAICFKKFSSYSELKNASDLERRTFKVKKEGIEWPLIGFTMKREDIDPTFNKPKGSFKSYVLGTGVMVRDFGPAYFEKFQNHPVLANATDEQRKNFKVTALGIEWPDLNFTLRRRDIRTNLDL